MRSFETIRPRPGLSIPALTVLDERGALVEDDQRRLVRFLIQDGYGADILFAGGTTGEWDRIEPALHRTVIEVCADEVRRYNTKIGSSDASFSEASGAQTSRQGVEFWAGITAHTKRDTLENLACAIRAGADAAVLAPLSIRDVDDPVQFLARDVADHLDASARRIPVFLYDNASIAADPKQPHIRTRQVKAMARLDFVRGVKVSAGKKVLGNYMKAAAKFRPRGEFGVYVGDPLLIFDIFRPRRGLAGVIAEYWNRYWLWGSMPTGVVAGPANVLPREWQRAWRICQAGDAERMRECEAVFEAFRASTRNAGGKRTLACLKRALRTLGVITKDCVAKGTPELSADEAQRFDAAFAALRNQIAAEFPEIWVSRVERIDER